MTSEDVILERIEHLSNTVQQQWEGIKSQSADITNIKKTVETIAVQSNRIDNLSGQVTELWTEKKEHESRINNIEKFQASCPRESSKIAQDKLEVRVDNTMKLQWTLISFLSLAIIGIFWKIA